MFKVLVFLAQVYAIIAVAASAEPLRVQVNQATPETVRPVPRPALLHLVDDEQQYCLTEAIYFEARNQTVDGKIAVGSVILNRVRSPDFPDTICDVVHQGPLDGSEISLNRCQFSYYCDGKSDDPPTENILEIAAWDLAYFVAEALLLDVVDRNAGGGTYYHADYVDPFWNEEYTQVAVVGKHIFYKHYE